MIDIDGVLVDYLSLMRKPENKPRVSFGLRNYFNGHVW